MSLCILYGCVYIPKNDYKIKNAASHRVDCELAGGNVASCTETPIEFANEIARRIKR